ncbi:MAG: transglycosylase SLT domain-containing protein [Gemmatimonadaceae bacterium]|nr:transglycosylase SLT domain-containing protein [Gemmatimonadaceae bacterium]
MKKPIRRTYVHRGDAARRRTRIKNALLALGFVAAVVLLVSSRSAVGEARAESAFSFGLTSESRRLSNELGEAKGELELTRNQLDRANRIIAFSSKYGVTADMASSIYDIAMAEGIEPDLGFRLVRLESEFNERAVSPVGAIGLTQVMPATAQYFLKGATREKLHDRDTNLRVGFRYLRTLIREYKGNLKIALLVYNRGPAAVDAALGMGLDPANGYDRIVMKGYHGRGTVD